MANWVRFADTKATILMAGLGVVLTMLMTNCKTIIAVLNSGCTDAFVVGTLSGLALLAVCYTLYWLVCAIGPQSRVAYRTLNRFAWPTLVGATTGELLTHVAKTDVREEAWQQVHDLSELAQRKFHACGRAVWGFAALVVLGVACVVAAISFTS